MEDHYNFVVFVVGFVDDGDSDSDLDLGSNEKILKTYKEMLSR